MRKLDSNLSKQGPRKAMLLICLFSFLQRLTRNTMISDIRGRKLPAKTVFTCAIRYLKDHLLDELKKTYHGSFESSEINWVLTFPASWDDKAKELFRDAAEKVRIRKRT